MAEVTDPAAADTFTYAWTLTKDGGPFASGSASTFTFTPDAAGSYQVTLIVEDDDRGADTDIRSISVTAGEVVGRHIFYNRSTFDGNDAGANEQDDLAIAPPPTVSGHGHPAVLDEPEKELGKRALLPGETATFVNYTSYLLGINGIMVDIANPPNLGGLDASDFEFRVGNDNDPAAGRRPRAGRNRVGQSMRTATGQPISTGSRSCGKTTTPTIRTCRVRGSTKSIRTASATSGCR